jgi:hypothetical protein
VEPQIVDRPFNGIQASEFVKQATSDSRWVGANEILKCWLDLIKHIYDDDGDDDGDA